MTFTVTEAGLALTDPTAYADEPRLHEALGLLRREAPVHRVEAAGFDPFWAVTRHADIMEIERNHTLFHNAPRPLLQTAEMDARQRQREADGMGLRTLIHMDDPQHRVVRAIGADWFKPRAMRAMEERVQQLARQYVARMSEYGGECDFATQVAVHYPLYVILSLLGLPESDFPRLLKLTQELFGGADEELRRGDTPEDLMETLLDFFAYFQDLTTARRATPTDDLASAIANARVDGEYLSDFDAASYYVIIATAGHDTTSSTISGGLHALIQHPGELARLRDDPALLPTAVDEMIRWVTPVKEFMRTATADTQVGGVPIQQGEALLLSYPSANRDEGVFDDPFRFDVGRDPNKHLAFGFGVHFCLGAALARMETRALFAELLPRLESIELAGQAEWMATTFVGGLKHLPIRYTLKG
ncbi:MAG: cytochrome [Actinomycetia bacterium]|nr:cytochrome [Actinomycetes bacterium]